MVRKEAWKESGGDVPVLEVPYHGDDTIWLEHTRELARRLVVVRAPVKGLWIVTRERRDTRLGCENIRDLCNDDEVRPAVLDMRGVECAVANTGTRVINCLRELVAHALAGLDGAQLLDGVLPVGMSEQRTRENACAGSQSDRPKSALGTKSQE
jgi:hypothetical protein